MREKMLDNKQRRFNLINKTFLDINYVIYSRKIIQRFSVLT